MIEIYNEKIQDLLVKPEKRTKDGLAVREHPQKGVFVEPLTLVPVSSYDEIQRQIDIGTQYRTIGSTNMNATSSRAHTVTQIVFKQSFFDQSGKPLRALTSNINLIDLAGSERAASTGATGDRLKEGANINKSLMILGKVISALAQASEKKGGTILIPYRESKLTFLLKPYLGGNAKTSMCAALSPANVNYDETLSTLRYANQVKNIKNQAKINESEADKLIRELREEIDRLKTGGASAGDSEEMKSKMQEHEEFMAKIESERAEFEAKLSEQRKQKAIEEEKEQMLKTRPQIRNINQDP